MASWWLDCKNCDLAFACGPCILPSRCHNISIWYVFQALLSFYQFLVALVNIYAVRLLNYSVRADCIFHWKVVFKVLAIFDDSEIEFKMFIPRLPQHLSQFLFDFHFDALNWFIPRRIRFPLQLLEMGLTQS